MPEILGLIVNPLAGIGGAVGLKGSDGPDIVAQAAARGGRSPVGDRAGAALQAFAGSSAAIVTAGGPMGEAACLDLGLPHRVVTRPAEVTGAADTMQATEAVIRAGAALILFAGGDGTARDVACRAGTTPILGIPAGVKMYSGVFAASAALAGRLAMQFLRTDPGLRRVAEADLLDADEEALRRDEPSLRLFGTALVPASPAVQRAKASVPAGDEGEIERLCHRLATDIEPDCLYVVGPGRTTRAFLEACGCAGTLLGVDIMRNRQLLATDVSEGELLALLQGQPVRLVVGLIGGQGCLFGRGNQQIGASVLRRVERSRTLVLASAAKIAALPHGLFVDTGDAGLDGSLEGFVRVETGVGRSTLLRVRQGADAGWGTGR